MRKPDLLKKTNYRLDTFFLNQMIYSGRSFLEKRARPMVHYIVIMDVGTLRRIGEINEFDMSAKGKTAAAILVLADVEEDEFWIEDASIATAAIQVAAEGAGVASCRVHIRNRKDKNGNDLSDLLQHMMLFPLKVEPVFMIFLFDSSEYHTNLISRLNKIHYERW